MPGRHGEIRGRKGAFLMIKLKPLMAANQRVDGQDVTLSAAVTLQVNSIIRKTNSSLAIISDD